MPRQALPIGERRDHQVAVPLNDAQLGVLNALSQTQGRKRTDVMRSALEVYRCVQGDPVLRSRYAHLSK